MKNQFVLNLDPVSATGTVLLNDCGISSQSQLRICSTDNFFNWYKELPTMLFSEVNDSYTLALRGSALEFLLLKAVFENARGCEGLTHLPHRSSYSVETRFSWLCDIVIAVGGQLPKMPRFTIKGEGVTKSVVDGILLSLPDFYKQYYSDGDCPVNIYICSNGMETGISPLTENDLAITSGTEMKAVIGSLPIIYAPTKSFEDIIRSWLDGMIFCPYLVYAEAYYHKLINSSTRFDLSARVKMLTRQLPVVELTAPDRLELGLSDKYRVYEFPESDLVMSFSDRSVVEVSADHLKAQREGTTDIVISSRGGDILCKKTLQVYTVNRVRSINLNAIISGVLMIGSSFTVHAVFIPHNAVNISNARWSVSNSSVLLNNGGGSFTAISSGSCDITLTVDKVSESVSVNVVPSPTDIKLPSEIRMKISSAPMGVNHSFVPRGSYAPKTVYRVTDPSVAKWDVATNTIVPANEGTTFLEATVLDASGNTILTKHVPLTVMPHRPVVTPPTALTVAVVFAICALVAYNLTLLGAI
ncbi:MAG: hypothetical protein E7675_04960, partial [Ruminococcaceae bacterium]|nr:hypothetical protein [Oscillospiraceae bacterium]